MTLAQVATPSRLQWADTAPSGRQVAIVLLASGVIGFLFGALSPTWQEAIAPSQVLAGLVRYPAPTPVFLYSIKSWTVIHQALALALEWGCSERTLTIVLSGATGMVSLQALAVFVLAICGDVTWAVLSSFFLFMSNATESGVTYPVLLMASPHTYGIIGLSYALLTIALIGAGRVRAGAVLLGFGPAIHITLGLLCLLAVGTAVLLFERPSARRWTSGAWPYLAAGLAAALASALIHFLRSDIDLRQAATGLRASASFTHYWGQSHRFPFAMLSGGILLAWANLGLSLFWLGPFREDLPAPARLILKILVAAALLGTMLSISYRLPPELVPNVLYALMPSRLLNLNVLTCMALILGLAWRYRDNVWIQALLAAIVVGCSARSVVTGGDDEISALLGIGLGGPALIVLVGLRRFGIGTRIAPARVMKSLRLAVLLAPAVALPLMVAVAILRFDTWMDRSNDQMYAVVANRTGLLLTAADIHLIQLQTRRPVLLDGGALDWLPYVPEGAAQADTILRRVYGVDSFHDVPIGSGGLWSDAGKALWEGRTAAEWDEIAREFGVTDILTYSDWRLTLPVVARDTDYILYRVR